MPCAHGAVFPAVLDVARIRHDHRNRVGNETLTDPTVVTDDGSKIGTVAAANMGEYPPSAIGDSDQRRWTDGNDAMGCDRKRGLASEMTPAPFLSRQRRRRASLGLRRLAERDLLMPRAA